MLHDMTHPPPPPKILKMAKNQNRMDNLDSARAFLTGKKNGKILRFSIFDGIPKKKIEKNRRGIPHTW